MNIALGALQIIIGLIFLFTGSLKMTIPKEKLPSKGVTGFENISPSLIKLLAFAEILGAVTLLIYSIPDFPKLPVLIATIGFSLLMLAATYHHWIRNERKNIVVTSVILIMCLIILMLSRK